MAGHSHWKQVKQKKGAEDQKRAKVFSKLLAAIAVAARGERNPQFNPQLRTAIEKAKAMNVPQSNIERAINRSTNSADTLEEIVLEAYGPGSAAILMRAVTDNRNRTINEVRQILKNADAKWADPGSVRWAFEETPEKTWNAKFMQKISATEKEALERLIEKLDEQDEVQDVFSNAA